MPLRRVLPMSLLLCAGLAQAEAPGYGPNLEGFTYPYAVKSFRFQSQRQPVEMAYMDVAGEEPNGHTVVLLHGKNFCGATWEGVIHPLSAAGYRVVVPDQIGFCKSSKPEAYQYGLHQLAANTQALADHLGVDRPVVVGHSMGGMLAMRYALMYPAAVEALVLVNPIGLEDWRALGVPPRSVDAWYQRELATSHHSLKAYQQATYYAGDWRPAYDRWVNMLAGMYAGDARPQVAWAQALASDMILNQPVVHELERIAVPTLLLIGERDTTAIGKDAAPAEAAAQLGHYAELGPRAAARIPGARLVRFPALGHAPQIQDVDQFNAVLDGELRQLLARAPGPPRVPVAGARR